MPTPPISGFYHRPGTGPFPGKPIAFYRDVLGGEVLRKGEPTFLRLGNMWITINGGGGPTDDKPEVVASPPRDPNVLLLSVVFGFTLTESKYTHGWCDT
jgi:hypothetical protein